MSRPETLAGIGVTNHEALLVGRLYGVMRRDPEAMLPTLDPEVEWVNHDEGVDPSPHHGHAGAIDIVRDLDEAFAEYRHELQELRRSGDQVVVEVDFMARARTGRREIWQKEVHTWTIRAGKVVRVEWGWASRSGSAAVPSNFTIGGKRRRR